VGGRIKRKAKGKRGGKNAIGDVGRSAVHEESAKGGKLEKTEKSCPITRRGRVKTVTLVKGSKKTQKRGGFGK